jgi:hypothetical protein
MRLDKVKPTISIQQAGIVLKAKTVESRVVRDASAELVNRVESTGAPYTSLVGFVAVRRTILAVNLTSLHFDCKVIARKLVPRLSICLGFLCHLVSDLDSTVLVLPVIVSRLFNLERLVEKVTASLEGKTHRHLGVRWHFVVIDLCQGVINLVVEGWCKD